MRRLYSALAFAMLVAPAVAVAQDEARSVANGGIKAKGWMGVADNGADINGSSLMAMGKMLHVKTGPAVTYWSNDNKASGDYTVKATFTEPKFQDLNDHPHPYGIVIAGNDMGTATGKYLYCAVNGNGSYIMRGMNPKPFQLNGRMGAKNDAIHKAAAKGEMVKNDIAVSVKGGTVSCAINGTVVGSWDKAALAAQGITATDGVYGIRFAHNTEGQVEGLAISKP